MKSYIILKVPISSSTEDKLKNKKHVADVSHFA